MNVVFRCDASQQLGSGHVMRCLTMADKMTSQGHSCFFVVIKHNDNLVDFIKNKYPAVEIEHEDLSSSLFGEGTHAFYPFQIDWQLTEQATKDLGIAIDLFVVDHYSLDHNWHYLAKNHCRKLLVIDDLANRLHLTDILIDPNLGKRDEDYNQLVASGTKIFTGLRYAILREEFFNQQAKALLNQQNMANPYKLLISLGGADDQNATLTVLNALTPIFDKLDITVVVGGLYPHMVSLQSFTRDYPSAKMKILSNVTNMAEVMSEQHFAIGASGTSCWERICLGIPSLNLILAPNQKENAENLATHELAINLGTLEQLSSKILCHHIISWQTRPEDFQTMVSHCANQIVQDNLLDLIINLEDK